MEERINKKCLYKIFLVTLKVIPYFIALCYIVYTLSGFGGKDWIVIGYIASCSILTWIILYLSSFVFGFCAYHRVPLYYVLLNDVLNIIDTYIGLPIETGSFFLLHVALLGIMSLLYVYLMLKNKKRHAQ